MARYALEFSKTGYMIYSSHLDMMRLFKRAFKRSGLPLSYSKGFNPHPRMSFAQPLSLGYSAEHEYLEFHLDEEIGTDEIRDRMNGAVPEGLEILGAMLLPEEGKTLASAVVSAEYELSFPLKGSEALKRFSEALEEYMSQQEIVTLKREKKSKQLKPVDIKPMIKDLSAAMAEDGTIILRALVDQGSASNLSPELIVDSLTEVLKRRGIGIDRYEVAATRKNLFFSSCFPHIEGLNYA